MNTESDAPPITQKTRLAHETLSSIIGPARRVIFQALAPPVGSVDVTTSPCRVMATHSVTDGHESAVNEFAAGTTAWVTLHALGSASSPEDSIQSDWDVWR